MGTGKVGTLRINFVWGAVQPERERRLRLEPLRRRSSAPRPSRASGSCPPSTARRPGPRTERTTRRPEAHRRLPGLRPGGRAALREQRHLLVQQPDDPEAPGDRLAALERDELAELLVPQAEREAVRLPAEGLQRRASRAATRARRSCSAGSSAPRGSGTGSRSTGTCPASTGPRARSSSTRSPCTPTRRPRRTPCGAVKDTRKIMAQFKDKKAKLWITEIGWATGGDPTPLTVSPQRQATYLRRATSCSRRTGSG